MDRVQPEEELEKLKGTIEEVIFHNDENGYTVLILEAEGLKEPVTVVGELPFAAEGEMLSVMGKWEIHPNYGRQLHIEYYEKQVPEGKEGMLRYLMSGAVKGIGPATAKKIVDVFGEDTFEVLEKNPEFLSRINGISAKKAKEIGEQFAAQFGMRSTLLFASRFFGSALAVAIYKKWGCAAEEVIRRNPYVLCEEIDGIGFERADGVAKELGVEENAPCRIEAAVLYVLQFHANSSGHTFLPRDKLVPTVAQLLSVGEEETEEAIDKLIALGTMS